MSSKFSIIKRFKFVNQLFFIIVLLISTTSIGQSSAQTEDFIAFGERSDSGNSGRLEKEMPLCVINKFGFNVNLGLHYSSEGFKPGKRESEVGHNWFINTGAVITRTVNGVEDELRDDRLPEAHGYDRKDKNDRIIIDGFYSAVLDQRAIHHSLEPFGKYNDSLPNKVLSKFYLGRDWNPFEMNPDVFHFNLGNGMSGKYYLDAFGGVRIKPNGPYHLKIDIEKFSIQRGEKELYDSRKPKDSEIVITDERGYKYYFGGNHNYLQWHYDIFAKNKHNEMRPVINAWNISRIVAPNGNVLTYTYAPYDLNYLNRKGVAQNVNESIAIQQEFNDEHIDWGISAEGSGFNINEDCKVRQTSFDYLNIIKKSNLTKININSQIDIDFNYVNLQNWQKNPGHLLNSITVSGNGTPNKEVRLEYEYYSERPFLTKIQIDNKEPYEFIYSKTDNLPNYNSPHRNKYGYYEYSTQTKYNNYGYGHSGSIKSRYAGTYNGARKRSRCLLDENGNFVELSVDVSTGIFSDVGLLKRIILPTKSTIGYEYKSLIGKNNRPLWSSQPREPITLTETNYYSDVFTDINLFVKNHKKLIFNKKYDYTRSSNTTVYPDNSSVLRSFGGNHEDANFRQVSPSFNLYQIILLYERFTYKTFNELHLNSYGNFLSELDYEYGPEPKNIIPLKGKIEHDKRQLEAVNEEKHLAEVPAQFLERDENGVYKLSNFLNLKRSYAQHAFLGEKRSYIYDQTAKESFATLNKDKKGNPIRKKLESTEQYIYNDRLFKLKEKITYADEALKTKVTYTYPFDVNSPSAVTQKMIDDNIVIPIYTTTEIIKGTESYIIGASGNSFKIENNLIVPFKSYEWSYKGESFNTSPPPLNIDNTGLVSIDNTQAFNTLITTYNEYTERGKPCSISTSLGNNTIVFYDSYEENVVLNITNLSFSELETIPNSESSNRYITEFSFDNYKEYLKNLFKAPLSKSPLANKLQSTNIDISKLKEKEITYLIDYLRENYPNARCKYNKYNDNSGLLEYIINSRNEKTSYEYDEEHRVITIRDFEGNIVKHNKFNIKK